MAVAKVAPLLAIVTTDVVGNPESFINCPRESNTIRVAVAIVIFLGKFSLSAVLSGFTGEL